MKKKKQIVGFWHIGENYYPSQENRDHFVMKQAQEILGTYIFNEGLRTGQYDLSLNYVTKVNLSDETKAFLDSTRIIHERPPTVLEMEDGVEYFEFPTLMELYAFCKAPENIDTTVFYIHSKTEDHKRIAYENYLLGQDCLQCLDGEEKVACGVTYKGIKGFPWAHFSGNFWMTDCAYISTLNAPWYPEILQEVHIPDAEMPWMAQPPYGRFFAEYWMMNDAGPRREHARDGISSPHLERSQICSDVYHYV